MYFVVVSSAVDRFSHLFPDVSAMPRGTPLYGQPSWWGDDEEEDQKAFKSNGKPEDKSHETGTSGKNISVIVIHGYFGKHL